MVYFRCTKYTNLPNKCVLVADPNDECCQVPYCDYLNPKPFPNGIPTPAPNKAPTPPPQPSNSTPGVIPNQPGIESRIFYCFWYYSNDDTSALRYSCGIVALMVWVFFVTIKLQIWFV